ncbi:nucleoside phosphorylase domain-containing protein [Delphinella strobiligena]|nr:nucleoside phosphorylase domain-containing protein [Delphinella strobiligena]
MDLPGRRNGPFPIDEFRVGWICALSIELTAALALLDERYLDTETPPSDENVYIFGRMHHHKVVIACLPFGISGTVTTANLASHMQRSFISMTIRLMVGIGGGVWSPEIDVRLGDVVVGASEDGNSGIIQYDYGKTIQDQEFSPKGSMNKAPLRLLRAISTIIAMHAYGEREYLRYICEAALKLNSDLAQRPDSTTDRLFRQDFLHTEGSQCNAHPANEVVDRPTRTNRVSEPRIHYGKIASGNTVMKDARMRERIRERHQIICFEMEAAGLMDHFPCLAVRGISDYADSHKNNAWHQYAALTAGAYAKELLRVIQPSITSTPSPAVRPMSNFGELTSDP